MNIFNFRNCIYGVLHSFGIGTCGNKHIKTAIEFLLFQIFGRRNTLDGITDLVQRVHDHDGACRLENTGLHQGNLDMEQIQTGFFCLLHDINIDLIEFQVNHSCITACSSRGCGRCCSGGCHSRRRCSFGDGAELDDKVGHVNDVLCLTVADAVHHLLEGVQTLEQGIHNVLIELQLVLTHEIEHVLHLMREFCNLGKAHRCRHALERMCIAKDVVNGVDLLHVLLETQKAFIE